MTDIAIYVPSLCGGGAERVMTTLANGFVERGLKVDLVLARAEGPYLGDVVPGVRIVDLRATRVLTSLLPLVRYLRDARPRAMLSALNYANVVAVVARGMARVSARLVISEHSNVSQQRASVRSPRGRAVFRLMRWTYSRAEGVVAVSGGVADDLAHVIGLPRERISVVYNPVVTEAVTDQTAAMLDHPWFKKGMPPVVLGAGRLNSAKDFPTLIRAFARVRAERPCRLLILGEGERRGELETLVAELRLEADVSLPGFKRNPFAFMRSASLFVLSSKSEGFGNVLVEAMACGIPVVSTNCPSGPAEILECGKWGRLVPVADVDALSRAILATLEESVHPDVARRAREFGVKQSVDGYLNVLFDSTNA